MAGEDCARKRQSGSATAHKPPENEEVQRRPEGERSFQNASNGEVLLIGLSGVCSSLYCGCLESNVACSWLAARVAAVACPLICRDNCVAVGVVLPVDTVTVLNSWVMLYRFPACW